MDKLKLSQNSALLCSHWSSPQTHPLLWGDFMLTRTSGSKWNQLNRFTLWKEYTSTAPAPALIKHKLMCLLWNCLFWWPPFGKYFREGISLKKSVTRRKYEQNTDYVSLWDYFQRILKSNEKICTPSKWFWGFNNSLQLFAENCGHCNTAVRALVWNNGTLLCKIIFNRNLSF